jgi:hypothetical protein
MRQQKVYPEKNGKNIEQKYDAAKNHYWIVADKDKRKN